MIDLTRTRTSMLTEIGAVDESSIPRFCDASDSEFADLDRARLVVRGTAPDDLLPRLGSALSQRFKQVPPAELSRGLLHVLKKTVGNAYKWGNQRDSEKRITIDVVVTRAGAVASVSDEGPGFDVADLLKRFENDEAYATHGGSGFAILEKSQSAISYADGGRTAHIEFRCMPGVDSETIGLAQATDDAFMMDLLGRNPELCRGETLLQCGISLSSKSKGANIDIRYDLTFQQTDSDEHRSQKLTGVLLREGNAESHAELLGRLHASCSEGMVRVARPLAVFPEPPLILFEFDPIGALDDWIKRFPSFDGFAEKARGVADCLRAVHGSELEVDACGPAQEAEKLRALGDRIVAILASASPARAPRAEALRDAILERWERVHAVPLHPIHGSFSWNSVAWTEEGLFLCGFNAPRRSHPGFDLGGFLADHLRFFVMRKKGDPTFHDRGREAFLDAYFCGESPEWRADLPFFCAVALLQRTERLLGRKQKKWEPKIDPLLEACEQSLVSFR